MGGAYWEFRRALSRCSEKNLALCPKVQKYSFKHPNIIYMYIYYTYCRVYQQDLGPLPPMNPLDFMYACMHKKEGRLENKKILELKNERYRDGIKRKETR